MFRNSKLSKNGFAYAAPGDGSSTEEQYITYHAGDLSNSSPVLAGTSNHRTAPKLIKAAVKTS